MQVYKSGLDWAKFLKRDVYPPKSSTEKSMFLLWWRSYVLRCRVWKDLQVEMICINTEAGLTSSVRSSVGVIVHDDHELEQYPPLHHHLHSVQSGPYD